MIVLDTNVVSELMRPEPNPAVVAWLDAQAAETLYLTSITVSELLYGVAALPDGKRKLLLQQYVNEVLGLFRERILSFDLPAALKYAELASTARKAGTGLPLADGYIAAITAAQGFIIATRDSEPFSAAGLKVVNPFR